MRRHDQPLRAGCGHAGPQNAGRPAIERPGRFGLAACGRLHSASNWAGYVSAIDLNNASDPANNSSVDLMSGSWNVPGVTASSNSAAKGQDQECFVWVGIDGFSDSTVEQIGTASKFAANGTISYYAWYEMYPSTSVIPLNNITVHAGDSITASVQYASSGANSFLLSITDNTSSSGTAFSASLGGSTSAARSSAEWIVEAPSSGSILPLPTFGSVTLTNASVTMNTSGGTVSGPIDEGAWNVGQIDLASKPPASTWHDVANTSPLADSPAVPSTSSFTVTQAPEPSALVILASAALAAGVSRAAKRRRKGNLKSQISNPKQIQNSKSEMFKTP